LTGAAPGLLADIGGTNARFALCADDGSIAALRVLACAEHPDPAAAAQAYLAEIAPPLRPIRGAFCVASPVTGDRVDMTNHVWSFSIETLRRALGFTSLRVVNDFVALARAVPAFTADDVRPIGGGAPAAQMPIAVIGPGTGLGVSGLVPAGGRRVALATEGGHVTLAAADMREDAVVAALRTARGHVSAERAISGPGLVNLYRTIAVLDGATPDDLAPHQVSARAIAGEDTHCAEALAMFASMLGTVAGNLALSLGARGGVYIGGGIVPRLGADFDAARFRARFEAKGRFVAYMANIPTYVITRAQPALLGLAALLTEDED
jgi:glucokinase